jgi:hypothetical protein
MTKSTNDLVEHIPKVRPTLFLSRRLVAVADSGIVAIEPSREGARRIFGMEMAISSSCSWRERTSEVSRLCSFESLRFSLTTGCVAQRCRGKEGSFSPSHNCSQNFTLTQRSTLQKALADRQKLIDEYASVTREWSKSNDPKIAKKREIVVDRMRAQYHELDPYVRGRGAYHRNGNVSSLPLRPP